MIPGRVTTRHWYLPVAKTWGWRGNAQWSPLPRLSQALLSGSASLRPPLAGLLENVSGPGEDVLLGREGIWKMHFSTPRQQSS